MAHKPDYVLCSLYVQHAADVWIRVLQNTHTHKQTHSLTHRHSQPQIPESPICLALNAVRSSRVPTCQLVYLSVYVCVFVFLCARVSVCLCVCRAIIPNLLSLPCHKHEHQTEYCLLGLGERCVSNCFLLGASGDALRARNAPNAHTGTAQRPKILDYEQTYITYI